ncbi:MAG: hypothetical protein HOP33_14450 [Verrucomicrobia bacterium]|nr:hypothetical protein [Verrucomicrobiota bacterium]
MTRQSPSRTLAQADLEQVEHIIYKSADDIAVSISRSFERMEERIEAMESRLYARLADIEDLMAEKRVEQADRNGSPSLA